MPFAASNIMHAFCVISSALFAASYAKILEPSYTPSSADPTITKAPQVNFKLLRKQNDNRFIGWLSLSDSIWESEQCSTGLTFFSDHLWYVGVLYGLSTKLLGDWMRCWDFDIFAYINGNEATCHIRVRLNLHRSYISVIHRLQYSVHIREHARRRSSHEHLLRYQSRELELL